MLLFHKLFRLKTTVFKRGLARTALVAIFLMGLPACNPVNAQPLVDDVSVAPQVVDSLEVTATQPEPSPPAEEAVPLGDADPTPVEADPEGGADSPPTEAPPTAVPPTATTAPDPPVSAISFSGTVGSMAGLYLPQDLSVIAQTGRVQFLNVYANW